MEGYCLLASSLLAVATFVACVGSATGSCTQGSCAEDGSHMSHEIFDDMALLQTNIRSGKSSTGKAELQAESQQARASQVRAEAHETLPSFASFMAMHGRTYSPGSDEYKTRHALFQQRAAEVKRHNSKVNRLWTASVNHLSDRTEKELKQLRGWRGFARRGGRSAQSARSMLSVSQSQHHELPAEISWGNLSAITRDTDQYSCGSCWAAATITMMNAADEIAGRGRLFSVQDLVDCVPNPYNCGGSGGCTGATVELAMNWIAANGLRPESQSPYLGYDSVCQVSLLEQSAVVHSEKSKIQYNEELENMIAIGVHTVAAGSAGAALGLNYWTRLPENEYEPLLSNLVAHGPLAVSVAADDWDPYSYGIFDRCSVNAVIDHAVVLFGYGTDAASGIKFWDIKNSWGLAWGDNGNIRLIREDTVQCGVDTQPDVGTGCDGGPSEVTVCGTCGILYDVVSVDMR